MDTWRSHIIYSHWVINKFGHLTEPYYTYINRYSSSDYGFIIFLDHSLWGDLSSSDCILGLHLTKTPRRTKPLACIPNPRIIHALVFGDKKKKNIDQREAHYHRSADLDVGDEKHINNQLYLLTFPFTKVRWWPRLKMYDLCSPLL